ncbi:hypothetical protein [Geminocystis sp. NIES-3708]|uniref:hypothetical protein n=1 Tax=Geminocystis sp. NIES-3708 TaxID=1615909 RepID=UPI00130DB155|nr:hypothetical protein [Geminocystis sp. NIES-3708]
MSTILIPENRFYLSLAKENGESKTGRTSEFDRRKMVKTRQVDKWTGRKITNSYTF